MPLIQHTNKHSLVRVLALVALLCAGALQIQEAGHDHWSSIDDSYSQCLVCKAGTAMLPSAAPVDTLLGSAGVDKSRPTRATLAASSTPFLARGPPSYS